MNPDVAREAVMVEDDFFPCSFLFLLLLFRTALRNLFILGWFMDMDG